MSTPALIIEHCALAGVDLTGPQKEALTKGSAKANDSKLSQLVMAATGGGGRQSVQQQRMSSSGQGAGQPGFNQTAPAIIEAKPLVAREPEQRNRNLDQQLFDAAKDGKAAQISSLVSGGAYVNMTDPMGGTPLLAATEGAHVEAVKELLKNGADVNLARKDGTSPLIVAYKKNKKDILKALTASAFQTLDRAVHQTSNAGMMQCSYNPIGEEEEGVSNIDLLQMRDETVKLIHMKPSVAEDTFVSTQKPIPQFEGNPDDVAMLREGAVRMLMQDLNKVSQSPMK